MINFSSNSNNKENSNSNNNLTNLDNLIITNNNLLDNGTSPFNLYNNKKKQENEISIKIIKKINKNNNENNIR